MTEGHRLNPPPRRAATAKKYRLLPGWINSRNDREWHFIDATLLAELYRVPMSECVIGHRRDDPPGLVNLAPSFRGNYTLPKVASK